jgi:hypothetical protein
MTFLEPPASFCRIWICNIPRQEMDPDRHLDFLNFANKLLRTSHKCVLRQKSQRSDTDTDTDTSVHTCDVPRRYNGAFEL